VFPIGFSVERDPEFPPEGGTAPERIPPGLPAIGAVLRVTPVGGEPWDLAVGLPNWWRTPRATAIAFLSDGVGWVVDVAERRVLVRVAGAIRVFEAELAGLVLFTNGVDLTAVGSEGVVWNARDVVPADLKVLRADAEQATVSGYGGVDAVVALGDGRVLPR
jgi:hypothetical protein